MNAHVARLEWSQVWTEQPLPFFTGAAPHTSGHPLQCRARLAATMARRISAALAALPPDDIERLNAARAFLASF